MSKIESFNVTYDSGSDVLYISCRRDVAARGVEDKYGIVWRYDQTGALIGATIMDFVDFWGSQQSLLADQISSHFHIPPPQAAVVIEHAMGHRSN
jgi:uncharacterized protein YuzE